ncbi:MAG: hypothetical protein AVDCRST_MAG56-2149 [uncultured Cytophagales bacterium]|uniref:Uncharacterized protein n=1 Tax=uncultured Cytophagales bacterium TaxID=158755 RepID=A0A6J4IMM0_9SPHI|nr:MAG: hypothetical protein AVDCRST_MAG56-2149 [uncultured Cytophagales bacterium]
MARIKPASPNRLVPGMKMISTTISARANSSSKTNVSHSIGVSLRLMRS